MVTQSGWRIPDGVWRQGLCSVGQAQAWHKPTVMCRSDIMCTAQ